MCDTYKVLHCKLIKGKSTLSIWGMVKQIFHCYVILFQNLVAALLQLLAVCACIAALALCMVGLVDNVKVLTDDEWKDKNGLTS